jgi:hypothetical protein
MGAEAVLLLAASHPEISCSREVKAYRSGTLMPGKRGCRRVASAI